MDLVYISIKIFIYFTVLFVFVFIIGNMISDFKTTTNETKNINETEEKKVINCWGGLKASGGWGKFNNKNA